MMKDMRSEKLIGYNMSSSDKMIIELDENQYPYMVLKNKFHPMSLMSNLHSEASTHDHDNIVNSLLPLCEIDKDNMMGMTQDHCRTLKMTVNQELLISIAWIMPKEVRLFKLFPEVMFVDCTGKTNKEKLFLFTVTGQSSSATMFTVLRALIPNQRTWMFKWLFSVVFPALLDQEVLSRVNMIISDGDSHEYEQIDSFRKVYCKNDIRDRCGWHIVNIGWLKNLPSMEGYYPN